MSRTIRQQIFDALDVPLSVRDISTRFGMSMKDAAEHLQHVIKSAEADGWWLVIDGALCEKCDYRFSERTRLTKPSRCPKCKGERILPPTFYLTNK